MDVTSHHTHAAAKDPLKVIIAEDEAIVARNLQDILLELGYTVPGFAVDAEAALALVEAHTPDLMLIDIVLKGQRDGIWLARTLLEEHPLPFVYVTSHADRQTIALARRTRPNGYLVKPFTKDDIFAAVEMALANHIDARPPPDPVAMAETLDAQSGGLSPSHLRKVQNFVMRNLDQPLKLSDLAAVTGLSIHYFARAFKATVGTSPYQYVIEQRLEEAKRLLRRTDRPIMQVCWDVGYENQSHFTTLFKREVGVTPGRYRRMP